MRKYQLTLVTIALLAAASPGIAQSIKLKSTRILLRPQRTSWSCQINSLGDLRRRGSLPVLNLLS